MGYGASTEEQSWQPDICINDLVKNLVRDFPMCLERGLGNIEIEKAGNRNLEYEWTASWTRLLKVSLMEYEFFNKWFEVAEYCYTNGVNNALVPNNFANKYTYESIKLYDGNYFHIDSQRLSHMTVTLKVFNDIFVFLFKAKNSSLEVRVVYLYNNSELKRLGLEVDAGVEGQCIFSRWVKDGEVYYKKMGSGYIGIVYYLKNIFERIKEYIDKFCHKGMFLFDKCCRPLSLQSTR